MPEKLAKYPNFMTFAAKINKIPKFYMIFARKVPEFYVIIARKIFFRNFGEHAPPTPVHCDDKEDDKKTEKR